jgi:hypothetical protein
MPHSDTKIGDATAVVNKTRVALARNTSRGLSAVLLTAVVAAAVCGCSAPGTTTTTAAMVAPMPSPTGDVVGRDPSQPGVRIGSDHLQARVLNVSELSLNAPSQSLGLSRYETVTYEVTNQTPEKELFMPRRQILVADNKAYSPDRDATIAIGQTLTPQIIGGSTTIECKMAFAIPKTAKSIQPEIVNTEGIQWAANDH